jgi:hypothetical protein
MLYIHELEMTSLPTTNSSLEDSGTVTLISASKSTECLAAAHDSLDTFLSLDMLLTRAFPTSYLVRITHTAIVLVKLHFAATGVLNREGLNFKADDYLERLVKKFSGWGTLWSAQKLAHNFRRLREMLHQCGNDSLTSELAWLSVWALEEITSVETVGQVSTITGHSGPHGAGVSISQGLEGTEGATLSTFDEELLAWSLSGTSHSNVLQNTAHIALPSTSLDATQLVDWFGTDLDTSTFDFDGNLQFMIQPFD